MPWKILETFPVMSTNLPIEWLLKLRFEKSASNINCYLDEKSRVSEEATQVSAKLREVHFEEIHKKQWLKLQKHLFQAKDITSYLSVLVEDTSVNPALSERITNWARTERKLESDLARAREEFQAEFREKREALWDIASNPRFQMSLFELNPQFLQRVLHYIPKWKEERRTSDVRRIELALINYLGRFCAKTSCIGTTGPTFSAQALSTASQSVQLKWLPSADFPYGVSECRAFFTHWAADALADKIRADGDMRMRLPLRLHPAAIQDGQTLECIVSIPGNSFMPKQESIQISKKVSEALRWGDNRLSVFQILERLNVNAVEESSIRDELERLMSFRFLVDDLNVPPGTLSPLDHLQLKLRECRPVSALIEGWIQNVDRLLSLKSSFEGTDLKEKVNVLNTIETLFENMTGLGARRGAGEFYADRLVLYQDCRLAIQSFELGGTLMKDLLSHYTLALDLLTPLWLYRILPSRIFSNMFRAEIHEELKQKQTGTPAHRRVGQFLRDYMSLSKSPAMESIKENDEFLQWASEIVNLQKLAKEILTPPDLTAKEYNLQLDDKRIQSYREQMNVSLHSTDPALPVFVSGRVTRLAATNLEEIAKGNYDLVMDSLIFGGGMHLTALGLFNGDRNTRMAETENVLTKLSNFGNGRMTDVTRFNRQETKFTPWIRGGIDIEVGGPSFKTEDERATIRDLILDPNAEDPIQLMKNGKETPLEFHFPNVLRMDRKLLFEDFETHCPRIRYGKAVLQREQWRISSKHIQSWKSKKDDPFELFIRLVSLQRDVGFPDFVFIDPSNDKPNTMIDFQNAFFCEILLGLANESDSFRVSEMLPRPDQFWTHRTPEESTTIGLMPFFYLDQDSSGA